MQESLHTETPGSRTEKPGAPVRRNPGLPYGDTRGSRTEKPGAPNAGIATYSLQMHESLHTVSKCISLSTSPESGKVQKFCGHNLKGQKKVELKWGGASQFYISLHYSAACGLPGSQMHEMKIMIFALR